MACGLSCILDIDSEEVTGSQRMLFPEEIWNELQSKYIKKHKVTSTSLPADLKKQWKVVSSLCKIDNDTRNARRLICKLKLSPTISVKQERCLDFINEILYQIDSKQFMFDERNIKKVSERDYVYQLWVSVLSRLFFINNNTVRIKVGETVLAGTTFSKSLLYADVENIVGFKVDIRMLVDHADEEFDLMCGEACLPSASEVKYKSDSSKLIREGKEMQRNLDNIFYNDNNVGHAWLVQVHGTKCSFSTVHPTSYHYHVSVRQFDLTFPTKCCLLNEDGLNFLELLFTFKDSVESLAVKLQERLNFPMLQKSPERKQREPSEPTWFAPPKGDGFISRIPQHILFAKEEDFDSENEGSEESVDVEQPDEYGFVVRDGKYYNVYTEEYWNESPFGDESDSSKAKN